MRDHRRGLDGVGVWGYWDLSEVCTGVEMVSDPIWPVLSSHYLHFHLKAHISTFLGLFNYFEIKCFKLLNICFYIKFWYIYCESIHLVVFIYLKHKLKPQFGLYYFWYQFYVISMVVFIDYSLLISWLKYYHLNLKILVLHTILLVELFINLLEY